MQADGLWAVTSYFNPAGYRRRLANYRQFRRRLAVPLVAVELSFDGEFELDGGDAEILVQVHGSDVMWQKERLLNIGIERVPKACRKVAWLDCDIIFEREDWPELAVRALDELSLLHLFEVRRNLPRDVPLERIETGDSFSEARSVVHKMLEGDAAPEDLFLADAPVLRGTTAGLAWASRREVLDGRGLYDACILGTGDRAILCAALGQFQHGARATLMNDRRIEHYMNWATPFFNETRRRVGNIPGCVFHLWHGDMLNRQYQERHKLLESFDPFSDIVVDRNGCWRWNSDKTELHASVKAYFGSRNEDGE